MDTAKKRRFSQTRYGDRERRRHIGLGVSKALLSSYLCCWSPPSPPLYSSAVYVCMCVWGLTSICCEEDEVLADDTKQTKRGRQRHDGIGSRQMSARDQYSMGRMVMSICIACGVGDRRSKALSLPLTRHSKRIFVGSHPTIRTAAQRAC